MALDPRWEDTSYVRQEPKLGLIALRNVQFYCSIELSEPHLAMSRNLIEELTCAAQTRTS